MTEEEYREQVQDQPAYGLAITARGPLAEVELAVAGDTKRFVFKGDRPCHSKSTFAQALRDVLRRVEAE